MWVRDLADATRATCGGKAANLARLSAAGFAIPPAFVIEDGAFRAIAGAAPTELAAIGHALEAAAQRLAHAEIPAALYADVLARARRLGDEIIVRSSCSIEDAGGGSAAGVFQSVVETSERVWEAIRVVWASALTPLAIAYARGRPIAVGAIVQQRVRGELVTIYTRPPDAADGTEAWVQRGTAIAKRPRGTDDAAIEAAIDATATGADVERVGAWLVQARPIVRRPPAIARTPPPPAILAGLVADGRTWTLDVTHNPAPLSVAQAELVERVERAGIAPWHMRVAGGYLYTTPAETDAAGNDTRSIAAPEARDAATTLAALADIEARLAATLVESPTSIADALDRYLAFYAIWARELSPLVGAALRSRGKLDARPPRLRALLADPRALADMSPAWDVAVPTYAETPDRVRDAIARAQLLPSATTDDAADPIAALAERDDDWFYRAQAMVRRAILARGDDYFWLPLDAELDPITAQRRAAAARAAAERAARWQMPHTIPALPAADRIALHGRGIGPRVSGSVVRFDPAVAIPPGSVVVCQTITPAIAVLVIGAAAIVSESAHVGLLDHAIALARELDITCVVDCHDAWSRLANADYVTVDGAAGTVEIN